MAHPRRTHTRSLVGAVALIIVATACGGGDDSASDTDLGSGAESFTVQVASYDLAADGPQRFLVGLLAAEGGLVVGGEVELSFEYQGDGTSTTAAPDVLPSIDDVTARFTTVADGVEATDGPRPRQGDEGVGVYEAQGIEFSKAGFWEVTVTATFDGREQSVPASFEVADTHRVPSVGDPAPRTENLLPGAADTPVKAVDSRAEPDGSVPDPQLHELTVAQAIATARPTVVVISTPVFCVSRFCGPITDSVDEIATEFGDRANFVHIEVWRDFAGRALNKGAAEWIFQSPETDASEPWVFLVDGNGTIVRRWDNVTNGDDLRRAITSLL